jgi:hypothetical protein
MKRIQFGLLLLVMGLASGQLTGQDRRVSAPAWKLHATSRAASYDELLRAGVSLPDWSNGWAIAIEGEPRTANEYRATSDGTVRTGTVTLPGATQLAVWHATVAVDGAVVVSGHAYMSDRSAQYFIARIGSDGAVTGSVRTGPFAPQCICAAQDGSVWAVGSELDAEELGESYALVRHFDFEKGLIGQAVEADSFSPSQNPSRFMNRWVTGDTDSSWLRCDSKRAYVYSNQTDELIEVDARTHAVSRWQIDSSAGKVVGLAITASGELFANLLPDGDPTNGRPTLNLFALEKDKAGLSAGWVMAGQGTAKGLRLWGADGDRLVLEDMDGQPGKVVRWTEVSRAEHP